MVLDINNTGQSLPVLESYMVALYLSLISTQSRNKGLPLLAWRKDSREEIRRAKTKLKQHNKKSRLSVCLPALVAIQSCTVHDSLVVASCQIPWPIHFLGCGYVWYRLFTALCFSLPQGPRIPSDGFPPINIQRAHPSSWVST